MSSLEDTFGSGYQQIIIGFVVFFLEISINFSKLIVLEHANCKTTP